MENNTNEANDVATEVHQTFEAALATSKASAQEGVWKDLNLVDEAEYARETDDSGLEELGQDMEKNGQLQNVVLVPKGDGRYEVVVGTRRVRAAKKRGWKQIRADVKEGLTESQKYQIVIAENEERKDASPFYTGRMYKRIMAAEGMTKGQDLAQKLGKDPTVIYRYLALAELPAEIQEKLARASFSMTHLRELLRLTTPEAQFEMAEACEKGDWSCKVLKAKVDQALGGPKAAKEPKAVPDFQFKWKDRQLVIKYRPFRTDQEGLSAYVEEFAQAFRTYVETVPAPEPKSEEAPSAIAA